MRFRCCGTSSQKTLPILQCSSSPMTMISSWLPATATTSLSLPNKSRITGSSSSSVAKHVPRSGRRYSICWNALEKMV